MNNSLTTTQMLLDEGQWVHEKRPKRQIFLHHTVGSSARSAIAWWNQQPERVGTAFLIEQDGEIITAFPEGDWAFHLGVKGRSDLDIHSVGIELVAWGPVVQEAGAYRPLLPGSAAGLPQVPARHVEELAWRGQRWWHSYSPAQLSSLRGLLLYLCGRHNIPPAYNEDMWELSPPALAGWPGIWAHASVRADKTDCFPQPALVEMLKSLSAT